ncbi:BCCT family transporter [Mesonia sp.]|uniref:BCCT family transporter n=1 Tax=Mesonia sp. TaxID=1960830 RepID=UPI003F9C2A42
MNKMIAYLKENTLLCFSFLSILALSLYISLAPQQFYALIEQYSISIRNSFGVFYLWLGLACVIFLLVVAISPFGKRRLGGTTPEYGFFSWTAMLYSAGMGAGILLRAVQEPVFMQQNPPIQTGSSPEIIALEYTFYQWGFTAWAFYAFFALVIGYYVYIRKESILLSNSFSSAKTSNVIRSVDYLTVMTTVVAIVAAIALGTAQIEGGLQFLLGNEVSIYAYLFTFLIFLLAFISVYRGIHKGIKQISNLNIIITILLLGFVLFHSDLAQIFSNFFIASYHYVIDFIPLSLALGDHNPGKEFLTDWTFYYWAFWLSWAPFTGIFIARISKGRTVRQLIFGSLFLPCFGSFLWFSSFGTSAFQLIETWGVYEGEFSNVFTSLFVYLKAFPLSGFTSIVTILLLVGFLVTSVDSAIFVLSMFTDKGKENPKKSHRLLWAIALFLFTEAILILASYSAAGDVLTAMQKFLIITSLPFAFLTVLIGINLVKSILTEKKDYTNLNK